MQCTVSVSAAAWKQVLENMTDELTIREITSKDPPTIAKAFRAQGWNKTQDLYEKHHLQQSEGRRTVLIAETNGEFVGYLTIVWESDYHPFRDSCIPEIVDFNVLITQQRKGIGTILMDRAEARISERSKIAGICVGLDADFGAAQIMYARRGYIPDGRGIQYDGKQLKFGDKTIVDYSLCMCFTKKLKE